MAFTRFEEGTNDFLHLVKVKVQATPFLSKGEDVSFDYAKEAFQNVCEEKIDGERKHYNDMFGGSNPDDVPVNELKFHHYTCLRTLKAYYDKQDVSKRDAECCFWSLYNDWDDFEEYKPEGGCTSDIDADELPVKDLQPCMYTYFRILGGYWCKQEDGLGLWETITVNGETGYTKKE
jgi:hypothetical protein